MCKFFISPVCCHHLQVFWFTLKEIDRTLAGFIYATHNTSKQSFSLIFGDIYAE